MIKKLKIFTLLYILVLLSACKNNTKDKAPEMEEEITTDYTEMYRPQYHFSPVAKWMNDPNGLVYHQGVYHLFYQYYPDDTVWGPMHWGHAISEDMVHWEQKPIALFPDEHGYIFSGSAVVDVKNTAGFGTTDTPALVAIFTYHDPEGEKAKRKDFQTQGIAYSLDNGDSWIKYKGNPVIGNENTKDFRDPKVFWNDATNKWTMLLVAGDHMQIWLSDNLKDWEKVSTFGKKQGAHGGVWECPDLFPLKVGDTEEEKWVLLISINPGAPNGGSGTQYFVGDFDGTTFTSDQKETKWVDWGTDNYAGVTYNNVPSEERIFIGWMSNWDYARNTPTEKWRSAMTLPRKLSLQKFEDTYELLNYPISAVDTLIQKAATKEVVIAPEQIERIAFENFNQTEVRFTSAAKDFILMFKNEANEELILTMDGSRQMVLLDRIVSGKTDFQEDFGSVIHQMPIDKLPNAPFEVRILLDNSSIEVFINGGQYVMTDQIFPSQNYTILEIENSTAAPLELQDLQISKVKRIW